ncbi:Cupin 2 conserved barrel domain protein [Clostridium sp. DL-VIII]|nr:Cupin 2 conserved barrel domain protein [Clostridium sp. DL-VIII]
MKKIKDLLVLVITMIIAVSLVSCNNSQRSASSQESFTQKEIKTTDTNDNADKGTKEASSTANEENVKDLSEGVIFPKGEKSTDTEHFVGEEWVEMLISNDENFNCPTFNVTFKPGGRNSWHKHPGGQILLVTGGEGYYQEEGKPVQILHAGDVVKIPPNVKHWHGATPNSWFTHIAMLPNIEKGGVEWLEPVTDEEYNNLTK